MITFLSTTYADYLTLLLLRNDLNTESESWQTAYSVGEALTAAAVHAASGQPIGEAMRADLARRLENTVGTLIPHHEQNIRQVIESLDAQTKPQLAVTAKPAKPEEPPAPPKPEAEKPEEIPLSAGDQNVADKLMREAGNWFVLKHRNDKEEQAVKLLWVNPHTRNMLFVDQHGAKVALMAAGKVAKMIRVGTVRPMQQETSSFVSRSLRRIRRALEDSVHA